MSRKIEPVYEQTFLFPPRVEDWVGPEHPARFVREFVDGMDLKTMGISWGSDSVRGQPSYSAGLLLKVHLYGRFLGLRSFRKMETACRDNLGMLWLTGMNAPDHNTLWGFFKANKKSLGQVFKHSVRVALQADMVGLVLHALDGTKVQAAVANASGWHRKSLEDRLALFEERIEELERELEQSDQDGELPDMNVPEALQRNECLRATVRAALAELEETGENHLNPHDRDARVMKCRDKGINTFSYNDQAVVDEHSGIIVAQEATTDATDLRLLAGMVEQVKDTLEACAQTTVADAGYASAAQLAQAEQDGNEVVVNLPSRLKENPDEPFAGANFRYDAATNTMVCPRGEALEYTHTRWHTGKQEHLRCYRCRNRQCPVRAQCTKDPKGRKIEIGENYEALQRQRDTNRDHNQRHNLAKRKHIVEPVFGWIKQQLGFRRHTVFGIEGARAEWSLITTVYNLHRLHKRWRTDQLSPKPTPQGATTLAIPYRIAQRVQKHAKILAQRIISQVQLGNRTARAI